LRRSSIQAAVPSGLSCRATASVCGRCSLQNEVVELTRTIGVSFLFPATFLSAELRVGQRPDRHEVEVDRRHHVGVLAAEVGGDHRAEIAALRTEAVIAEHFGHEATPQACRRLRSDHSFRTSAEPEAG
jgi:hypothetical protein